MEKLKKIFTFKRIVALLTIIFVLTFAFQNLNAVQIKFIIFSLNIPLLLLILIILVLGIIIGSLFKKKDMKNIVREIQNETNEEFFDLKKRIKK